MIRIVAAFIFVALLAACSGSNRVEGVVPAWANTPHPTTQYTARRNNLEGRGPLAAEPTAKPAAQPQQEPKKPEIQSASEE